VQLQAAGVTHPVNRQPITVTMICHFHLLPTVNHCLAQPGITNKTHIMKHNLKTKPSGFITTYCYLLLVALLGGFTAPAAPVGTAFTYQGQMQTDSGPANGLYDFRFALFDAASLGAPLAAPVTNSAVVVSNGYFSVALDFGAAFAEARWLDIGVRTNGSPTPFTSLTPRQAITPTPNAIVASQLSGTLADAQLGTNVALLNRNNQAFTGNNTFAGSVGIGTTSPTERLHIASGSAPALRVENLGSGSAALQLADTDQEYELRLTSANKLSFFDLTAGSLARLTLDQAGYVGIGTSAPQYPLHVSSSDAYVASFESSHVEATRFVLNNTAPGGHPYRLSSTADGSPIGGGRFLISDLGQRAGPPHVGWQR